MSFFRVDLAEYAKTRELLAVAHERVKDIPSPAYVFVFERSDEDMKPIREWAHELGVVCEIIPAGGYTFVEMQDQDDAFALKLRFG